jgi:hypothetical protein
MLLMVTFPAGCTAAAPLLHRCTAVWCRVVDLIRDHGFADAGKWMKTWEHAWQVRQRMRRSWRGVCCALVQRVGCMH